MKGTWRKWRYGLGFAWIGAIETAIALGVVDSLSAVYAPLSRDLLLALWLLAYVLMMEIFMWVFRVWMVLQRMSVRKLPPGYRVIRDAALPSERVSYR